MFEPLSPDEISTATKAVKADERYRKTHRFLAATLAEPPKDGTPNGRVADLILIDRDGGLTTEVTVDLASNAIDDWRDLPGCHGSYLLEEFMLAAESIKKDDRWVAALKARGIDDVERVQHDPWPAGHFGFPSDDGRRLMRIVAYLRHSEPDNGYAHPIEGLVATMDVSTGEVLEILDETPETPIPTECANYDEEAVGGFRSTLRPLEIVQPEGPSFTVEGSRITWQNWALSASMHPIDALVIQGVTWNDGLRERPVLHRASLAEMVVPYGDSGAGHRWKNAFDSGELGMGRYPFLNSLKLGCDCLGEITYLDAWQVGERGDPLRIENAICIHEEDYGILWKHSDLSVFSTEVRRSRRLVVSSIHTVGNYEYGFYWYFYLDGTIQLEVKLTGILQTKAVTADGGLDHATLIAPGLAAPFHQHLFCFRLDMDVDGSGNHTVEEIELAGAPADDADNELGGVMRLQSTVLEDERMARRFVDASRGRSWKVSNSSSRNRLGQPVAYRLVPGSAPTLLAQPGSSVARRAAFATHNLWVTPYDRQELRAAGYPVCAPGGAGLPAYTDTNRSVRDTDVVLWHTFGVNHIPRPEDWPVMPVEYAGFSLVPCGFFDRNPALDVPPNDRVNGGHCH